MPISPLLLVCRVRADVGIGPYGREKTEIWQNVCKKFCPPGVWLPGGKRKK